MKIEFERFRRLGSFYILMKILLSLFVEKIKRVKLNR